MEALSARAALLPRVELVEPRSVLAKNTVESVQAGVIYGFAAQVDGLCRRLQDEVGPCTVVATGGLSGLIGPYSSAIEHHEPWLTLDGLRIIFGRNTVTVTMTAPLPIRTRRLNRLPGGAGSRARSNRDTIRA